MEGPKDLKERVLRGRELQADSHPTISNFEYQLSDLSITYGDLQTHAANFLLRELTQIPTLACANSPIPAPRYTPTYCRHTKEIFMDREESMGNFCRLLGLWSGAFICCWSARSSVARLFGFARWSLDHNPSRYSWVCFAVALWIFTLTSPFASHV